MLLSAIPRPRFFTQIINLPSLSFRFSLFFVHLESSFNSIEILVFKGNEAKAAALGPNHASIQGTHTQSSDEDSMDPSESTLTNVSSSMAQPSAANPITCFHCKVAVILRCHLFITVFLFFSLYFSFNIFVYFEFLYCHFCFNYYYYHHYHYQLQLFNIIIF
jgi:hypothetical protein